MKKIILLNAGSKTRRAFIAGAQNTPVAPLKSKLMVMFLTHNEPVVIRHQGSVIDFTDASVFTRLRANDALFCGILYEHFAALGIPASDPISLSFPNAEEKIAQMARFVRAGVPIPDTIIAREEGYQIEREYILSRVSFPLIYKLDGSQGNHVHKIESAEALDAIIAQKPKYQRFILQQFIPNTFDTRTLVAYGTILGSIKRIGAPGSFLNNVSKGASVEAFTLSDEEAAIATLATTTCGLDFGGVDIIHTVDGPVVLEVNKSPQITGFEQVHGKEYVFQSIARIITSQ